MLDIQIERRLKELEDSNERLAVTVAVLIESGKVDLGIQEKLEERLDVQCIRIDTLVRKIADLEV